MYRRFGLLAITLIMTFALTRLYEPSNDASRSLHDGAPYANAWRL